MANSAVHGRGKVVIKGGWSYTFWAKKGNGGQQTNGKLGFKMGAGASLPFIEENPAKKGGFLVYGSAPLTNGKGRKQGRGEGPGVSALFPN